MKYNVERCLIKFLKLYNNAKILGVFYNVNEEMLTLIEDKVDMIIFDENRQDMSCKDFLDIVNEKYKKEIIVVSKKGVVLKSSESMCICSEDLDNNEVIDKIVLEILKKNRELIIEQIKKELEKINFNFSHVGTRYLISTIYEVYKIRNEENINLSKDIFPIIGKKFDKSANTIHSGIKREVINMYCDCEKKIFKEYFNCYYFEESPKLKEMIFKIIAKIN